MAAAKKSTKSEETAPEKKKVDIPSQVLEAINGAAKLLGVAAAELWGIFVRQYVVRGLNELFTAALLVTASFFLYPLIGLWILVPIAFAIALVYGAINYLGNPKYYALQDISDRVRSYKKDILLKEIDKKKRPWDYRS